MALFSKKNAKKNNGDTLLQSKGPVNKEFIQKLTAIYDEYQQGKATLTQKLIDNEDFWKMRQYETLERPDEKFVPATAWLWNCIVNKYSQLVEAYPAFNILPRTKDDVLEADILSEILPIVLRQAGHRKTYYESTLNLVIGGTCVIGVFWDSELLNGRGDISIQEIDLLNVSWENGLKNIQDSPYFFVTSLADTESLEERYPQYKGKLGKNARNEARYNYDDEVDTSKKSLIIEAYYKRKNGTRNLVHYCKFVNDCVLYATENETDPVTDEEGNVLALPLSQTGLYIDGKYPFVFNPLFRIKGSPAGYGYTDIGRDTQIQIDMLSNAVTNNAVMASKPRWFIRNDAKINESEYADWANDFVHVEGGYLSDDLLRQIKIDVLPSIYVNILRDRITELKETLGNRDVNNGGTVSGVTAASGIAALQEAGGRVDRASTLNTYDAQEEIVQMVISRIEQFYTTTRYFRILDKTGKVKFAEYKTKVDPLDPFADVPFFDIEITAEKSSPYKALSQNELMLQFYGAGFFEPSRAQSALACLNGMDFDGKEEVIEMIQANNLIMQQLVKLAAIVDSDHGTNIAARISTGNISNISVNEKQSYGSEPKHMQNARQNAQEASLPR